MAVEVSENIKASPDRVWKVVTDIDGAQRFISGIVAIEVLDRPRSGLVGLRWKETRKMFGKEATETMWISKVEENRWYETQAFNSGCEYNTRIAVEAVADGTKLTMRFDAKPLSLFAKLMTPLGSLFSGMIRKTLQQDLKDIKAKVEGAPGSDR